LTLSPTETPTAPVPPPHPWRTGLTLLARVVVASSLLAFLYHQIGGIAPVLAVLRGARIELVVAAFAAILLSHVLAADRLRAVIAAHGERATTWQLFELNLTTQFYGLFLPGGGITAMGIRFYRLSAVSRTYAAILVALVSDRLLSSLLLTVTGVLAWLIERPTHAGAAMVLMSAALLVQTAFVVSIFSGVASRFSKVIARVLPGGGERWARLIHSLDAYRGLRLSTVGPLMASAVGAQILGLAGYALLARAIARRLVASVGWIRATAALIAAIHLISGLGVRRRDRRAYSLERDLPGSSRRVFAARVLGRSLDRAPGRRAPSRALAACATRGGPAQAAAFAATSTARAA
jgi:hypothetical protein